MLDVGTSGLYRVVHLRAAWVGELQDLDSGILRLWATCVRDWLWYLGQDRTSSGAYPIGAHIELPKIFVLFGLSIDCQLAILITVATYARAVLCAENIMRQETARLFEVLRGFVSGVSNSQAQRDGVV